MSFLGLNANNSFEMIEIIFSVQSAVDIIRPGKLKSMDQIIVLNFSSLEKITTFLESEKVRYDIINVREDFDDIVTKIAKIILRNIREDFLINLINVPSFITISSITPFILLNKDAELVFPSTSIFIKELMPVYFTYEHLKVLKSISNGAKSLPEMVEQTDLPLTTLWRRVQEMKEYELLTDKYKITRKGQLMLNIFEE